MKVVIAGGGTGGHLFPALAVADEFKHRDSSTEVVFIGTEHGIEARIIPREGYPIRFLFAHGFVGVSVFKKIKAIFGVFFSMISSYKMFKEIKPDVVLGAGGYASLGPVVTAFMMSIPTMILEQNTIPGLANKMLGKFAGAVAVTYQESISIFPRGKTFLTGNPIREKILKGSKDAAYNIFALEKNRFTVFVFGGSLGARSINNAVIGAFSSMLDLKDKIQFLHQTGEQDCEFVKETYRRWGFRGTVVPFIFQMAEAYAVADIVISRAGATTLAEITAIGKPAVLIPYPYAAGSHQEINANKLSEIKAAKMILDHQLKGEVLAQSIRELFTDEDLRTEMERNSRSVGRPDAAQKIVDIAKSLARKAKIGNRQKENAGV
jgi:UDP-N-acetylglucosamine--N-acetylmuramyl-(pentapeptide) pyrophosphoryl-undecaprenol N-acetylglucosamine transferase